MEFLYYSLIKVIYFLILKLNGIDNNLKGLYFWIGKDFIE